MQRLVLAFTLVFACACAAFAADDSFTVTGVPVDASAASAATARTLAINNGRGRAWTTLYRRLTKQQDWGKQPQLDDAALQRLVSNYIVANERRSTTRFVANVTYIFNSEAVRRLLRSQSVAYVDVAEVKPVMIIPMAPGYTAHSPWANAWANPKYASGAVPLVQPVGDAVDSQELEPLSFLAAQWQDVEPAASRLRATDAFLVQVIPGKGNITVYIRRLSASGATTIPHIVVPVRPGENPQQVYGAAADAAATSIIDVWKSRSAIDFNKRSRLTAVVHTSSLVDWGTIMQKLSAIPAVTEVNVVAMDIGEARIAITYVGSVEQLAQFAAQSNLSLINNAGAWQISLGAPAPSQPPP